ncbi:MAG: hypothetical protein HQK53_13495 [Oligoflexia bacterium]|nr:hypothetical protein [Oligoflexia bacterium]
MKNKFFSSLVATLVISLSTLQLPSLVAAEGAPVAGDSSSTVSTRMHIGLDIVSCEVALLNSSDYIIGRFYGTSARMSYIKARDRACAKAMAKCMMFINNDYQRCVFTGY